MTSNQTDNVSTDILYFFFVRLSSKKQRQLKQEVTVIAYMYIVRFRKLSLVMRQAMFFSASRQF